jgi:DNA-directed RNA polymerase subunit RPC12/RpoP
MNDWTYNSDWAYLEEETEKSIEYKRQRCWHNFKPILLLISTVYDCEYCGIKKENWEKGIFTDEKSKSVF